MVCLTYHLVVKFVSSSGKFNRSSCVCGVGSAPIMVLGLQLQACVVTMTNKNISTMPQLLAPSKTQVIEKCKTDKIYIEVFPRFSGLLIMP